MGKLYRATHEHFKWDTGPGSIVEIGSDRYEGSTKYYAQMAAENDSHLHTIDLDPECEHRVMNTTREFRQRVTFHNDNGVNWAQQYSGPPIKVLYLDNFDWNWSVIRPDPRIVEQAEWYADRGLTMTNLESARVHLQQMELLLPHMHEHSVVVLDDTYEYNGVYIGKGGSVVTYLLNHGYSIVRAEDHGVILHR